MYHKNELDFMPGIYRCYGDIQYLRFRIRLEVIKSSTIPLSNVEGQETGLDPQYNEREEMEFSWNEKIFSPREFEQYREERNCKTPLESEYHHRILKLISDGVTSTSNRLFTYISKDRVPTDLYRNIFYAENFNKLPCSENKFISQKLFANACNSFDIVEPGVQLPGKNIIDRCPSDELRRQNRALFTNYETMYIVADLSDRHQNSGTTDGSNNYLLVTIKWNEGSSVLMVIPDIAAFNTSGYKVDIDKSNDTRFVYRYWLINISPTKEETLLDKRGNFVQEFASHQSLCYSLDFDIPFKDLQNYFLFVEIKKTVGFLCNNLLVQYFIQLPQGWSTDSPELLCGSTQQCRNKSSEYQAQFSYSFEIKMSHKVEHDFYEKYSSVYAVPQIFFEVCSLDNWNRFRVEGYAWMNLPQSPGRFTCCLDTWRPSSFSRRDQLTRYFLGSDCQLTDFSYPGIPTVMSNLLSKYGLHTVASGSVLVDFNVVQQVGLAVTPPLKKNVRHMDKGMTNTLMNSVNHILEAFREARQRMLLAREPILQHLATTTG